MLLFVAIMSCATLFAGNANLFNYDQEKINHEMISLDKLENYILSQGHADNDVLVASNIDLTTNALNPAGLAFGIEDVEWGSFAWGFCCWPVGIFTVILNDEKDKNHKISYFAGIITSAIIGAIGRLTYTILYLA